ARCWPPPPPANAAAKAGEGRKCCWRSSTARRSSASQWRACQQGVQYDSSLDSYVVRYISATQVTP
ncbi:unnamed protein product, partial [Polarella glacialis]